MTVWTLTIRLGIFFINSWSHELEVNPSTHGAVESQLKTAIHMELDQCPELKDLNLNLS